MMHITGQEVSYLYICKRKLWLYRHGLRPERENINVQIGTQIQRETFSREEKEIQIGDIGVLDWASLKNGVIHETKKGKTPGKGDVAQVRYYMGYLNEHGINIRSAEIHYPLKRRTETVKWDAACQSQMYADIEAVRTILDMQQPPPVSDYSYCKSCAYQEMCYA